MSTLPDDLRYACGCEPEIYDHHSVYNIADIECPQHGEPLAVEDRSEDAYRTGPSDPGWRPIETAPKDARAEKPILVYGDDLCSGGCRLAWWDDEREAWLWRWAVGQKPIVLHPTHWMPLPAPPEEPREES